MLIKIQVNLFIWGVLRRFQHCSGYITIGSFEGRENQYTQLVKVLYCKLLTIDKKLPPFPHKILGLRLLTVEVGGNRVTIAPPWPPKYKLI